MSLKGDVAIHTPWQRVWLTDLNQAGPCVRGIKKRKAEFHSAVNN